MPTAMSVTAPLLLAAVLILSGVGKLGSPDRATDAFTAMDVPRWLKRPAIIRAHPWGELALAVLLLVVPGPLGVVVAGAALLLMFAYVVLVVRALRSPVDVDCACFGNLGGDRVTVAAVWRNAWLTALAAIALVGSLEGRAVVGRVGDLESTDLWWLGSIAAAVVTTAFVLGVGRYPRVEGRAPWVGAPVGEDDDFIRSRTPAVPVLLGDGTRTDLRILSAQKAQLLIFVSELCTSCVPIIEAVPGWRRQIPQLDVRLVLKVSPELAGLTSAQEPRTLHDVEALVRESFGIRGTPAAILLGADGLLAGGPVVGADDVPAFVADIAEQLGA